MKDEIAAACARNGFLVPSDGHSFEGALRLVFDLIEILEARVSNLEGGK